MIKILFNFITYIFLLFVIPFNKPIEIQNNDNYFFIINIPKIDLYKEVYKYNNHNNNVNKGIYLVKDYDFNTLNGSLILASHSGNSDISYFKNLNLLKKNDIVKIFINDRIVYYAVTDKYKINKTGKFKYHDKNAYLYLITCDKNNNNKQIVVVGKIVKIMKKSTFF